MNSLSAKEKRRVVIRYILHLYLTQNQGNFTRLSYVKGYFMWSLLAEIFVIYVKHKGQAICCEEMVTGFISMHQLTFVLNLSYIL